MSAPKVLGVEMVWVEPAPLAELWKAQFGTLTVVLCRYDDGRFNSKLDPWAIDVGDTEERFVDRSDAVAAIERELLAIKSAIPDSPGGEG